MTTEERFWEKVDKSGECWVWTGAIQSKGYGTFATGSTRATLKVVLPHRYSWELHFGPIPDGLLILHACDNPPCVRPGHLMLGTYQANRVDCAHKGRDGSKRSAA